MIFIANTRLVKYLHLPISEKIWLSFVACGFRQLIVATQDCVTSLDLKRRRLPQISYVLVSIFNMCALISLLGI